MLEFIMKMKALGTAIEIGIAVLVVGGIIGYFAYQCVKDLINKRRKDENN